MILFHEFKNKYITATITLINRIARGEKIKKSQLGTCIQEEVCENTPAIGWQYIARLQEDYALFDNEQTQYLKLKGYGEKEGAIAIRPTISEKIWLKEMLQDEKAKLFLEDETLIKLKKALEGVENFEIQKNIEIEGRKQNKDVLDEAYIKHFKLVKQAIEEGRYLIYTNYTAKGEVLRDKEAIPYKLEYDLLEQKFRVSMWNEQQERPIKANLDRLSELALGDKVTTKKFLSSEEMISSKLVDEKLTFCVKNENNAIERTMLLFATYDRSIRRLEDDTYMIEISFYTFQEQELIQKVLSMGKEARVMGPEKIVSEIKRRLFIGYA